MRMSTGHFLNRVQATALPMSNDVIDKIHQLAQCQKANPRLLLADWNMTIDKENTNDENDSDDDYDPYENVSKDEYDNDTNSWDVNEPQDNGDVGLDTGDHDQSNDGETTDGNNDPEQDQHDDWMYSFDHNEGITQEAPQDNSGDNVSNEQMGLNEVIIKVY